VLIHRAEDYLVSVPARAYWGAEGEDPPADPPPPETPPAPEPQDKQPETFPADYVERLRAEAAANRVKSKEEKERAEKAEAELKKIRDAELSEIEKAQKLAEESTSRASAAEAKAQALALALTVEREANKLNFRDPSDAQSMLSLDNIELDDDGLPARDGIEKQLTKLAKKKPYLLKESSPGDGDGGPKDPPKPTDAFSKKREEEAARLKEQGYIAMPTR